MRVWTDEQKQRHREAIRRWAPWTRSTGPRTTAGKRISSRNSFKHGDRSSDHRFVRSYLYAYGKFMRGVDEHYRFMRAFRRYCRENGIRANELLSPDEEYALLKAKLSREIDIFHQRLAKIPAIKEFQDWNHG